MREQAPTLTPALSLPGGRGSHFDPLAAHLGIPVFLVSTGVEKVAVRFRKPGERFLDRMTLSGARGYLEAGEFPEGSMGPKVRAAVEFIERRGARAIITSPDHLEDALAGRTGTHVVAG